MNNRVKNFIYIIVTIISIVLVILGLRAFDNKAQPRVDVEDDTLSYDGKSYVINRNVETFLLIGVDDFAEDVKYDSYVNTYQSDFLLLLVFDAAKEEVKGIQINRDSITDVTVLGIQGQRIAKEPMQIALAHTYGTGEMDSAINTVKAVEDLFGISVDHYARVTMDAIPVANDAVGGVTLVPQVSIPDAGIEQHPVKGQQHASQAHMQSVPCRDFLHPAGDFEETDYDDGGKYDPVPYQWYFLQGEQPAEETGRTCQQNRGMKFYQSLFHNSR